MLPRLFKRRELPFVGRRQCGHGVGLRAVDPAFAAPDDIDARALHLLGKLLGPTSLRHQVG